MGSTVSAILFSGRNVVAANVGDSPIYLLHGDRIDEISVPHTLAAERAAMGIACENQPDNAAHHILTRAIGTQQSVTPHICEVPSFPGDILVACSDGLSNKVAKEEIDRVVRSMAPDQACRHLVDLANERGGEDNITVLVARISGGAFRSNPVDKFKAFFFRSVLSKFRNKR